MKERGQLTRRGWLGATTSLWLAAPMATRAADGGVLSVTGDVLHSLRLEVRDLAAFPPADQADSRVVRQVDGRDRVTLARGVRLQAVLRRAALADSDRLEWRRTIVLATAADGYRAVFSWPELFNTEVGAQVLVLYQRDGGALDAVEGPLALLAAADVRPGPRHVRQLVRLQVHILRELPPTAAERR